MARRELTETNAGSMADIAFLLLVFFLVVTTMNADKGMTRLLPPPVLDIDENVIIRERDVYEVMVNLNNDLFVEGVPLEVGELKQGAKNFLMSNGDNVLRPLSAPIPNFPIRKIINRDSVKQAAFALENRIQALKKEKNTLTDVATLSEIEKSIEETKSALDKTRARLYALDIFGDYAPLPGMALISVQNDNATDYATYVAVNNELEAAVRELRDEVSLKKFGVIYSKLRADDDEDKRKIRAIRELYPQRISEAEPLDVAQNHRRARE
ncbi:MAG: biopolymer transporter ExbD [Flavobacteriales bacterium]